jgi:hypothetical protein
MAAGAVRFAAWHDKLDVARSMSRCAPVNVFGSAIVNMPGSTARRRQALKD